MENEFNYILVLVVPWVVVIAAYLYYRQRQKKKS
jgi:hypothetical protein